MRIAFVTAGVPHYRGPFFAAMAGLGHEVHVIAAGKLGAGFSQLEQGERFSIHSIPAERWSWRREVVALILNLAPDVLVLEHGARLDFTWSVLLSARLRRTPRALWSHGIERKELHGGVKSLGMLGRRLQLGLADGIICYDALMAERMRDAFPSKVVGVAPNSNDGRPIAAARSRLLAEGRQSVRSRLGLVHDQWLLGLGRLVPEKEFDRLVSVLAAVREQGVSAGLLLVGGGPGRPGLEALAQAAGLRVGKDVIFTGAVSQPEELATWMFAADLCVNPGYLGLSVVDCMFAGLPTLSSMPSVAGPWHSPEWRYITRDVTGFLVAENTNEALVTGCLDYLRRPARERRATEEACAAYAATNLGVDNMAAGMMDVLKRMVK